MSIHRARQPNPRAPPSVHANADPQANPHASPNAIANPNPNANPSRIRGLVRAAAFASALAEPELRRIEHDLQERQVAAGGHVAWKGDAALHWMVVVEGMVKVEAATADGRKTTLVQITNGGWFGEAALLGSGRWPFDVIASQHTTLGLLPRATFDGLLDTSLAFNRFLLGQFNARLSQFVQRCEHVRLCDASEHVAHCLGELFDRRLYPQTADRLSLSQAEVAQLAGISRPTANRALHALEEQGVLSVAYGGIVVHDAQALRRLGRVH
jgi:CRP/FNR family transcriptional regulator, cyclic AMP receptor protein